MRTKPSKKKQVANRKLATRISGKKDVIVDYGRGPWVQNNKEISIPFRGVNYAEMLGLLAHEAGHIGYGSFSHSLRKLQEYITLKYKINRSDAESLINTVEDCRVNRINQKFYPGFYRPLRELEQKNLKNRDHHR